MKTKLMKLGFISLLIIAMVFVMPVAAGGHDEPAPTPTQAGIVDNRYDYCEGDDCVNGNSDTATANGKGGIAIVDGNYNDNDYNNVYEYDYSQTEYNTELNIDNSVDRSTTNIDNSVDNSRNDNRVDNSVDNSVDTTVGVFGSNNQINTVVGDNNQVNNNDVDVRQKQQQQQQQKQQQQQQQKQFQTQANVQTVNVDLPKGADGGLLISNSNKAPTVTQLDVGESKVFSRLVYPGEVLTFDVNNGDVVGVKSSSDIAFYTIGNNFDDVIRVGASEATPSYDPYYHKMVFGSVVPVDFTNYFTTKAMMTAGIDAKQVVVDNRAPRNSYTHIEITITGGNPSYAPAPEPTPKPLAPDVYPTDAYGHAITS